MVDFLRVFWSSDSLSSICFIPLTLLIPTNCVDRCISKPCVPLVITKAQSYLREVFCCLFIIVLTWASRPHLFLTEVQCHPLSPVLWLLHCCCYTVDLRPFFAFLATLHMHLALVCVIAECGRALQEKVFLGVKKKISLFSSAS